MQFMSQEMRSLLTQDHTPMIKVQALRGETLTDLDVLSGTVTYDYDDATRSSLDLEIIDYETRAFTEMRTLLDPMITNYVVYRGLQFPNGTNEMVQAGIYYPISVKPTGQKNGYPTWSIKAFDASVRCQDELSASEFIEAGEKVTDAVRRLLSKKLPSLQFKLPNTPWVTPALYIRQDSDLWQEARKLMQANGHDLYVDRGSFVTAVQRVLIPGNQSSWEFIDGANSTFWDETRELKNDAFPNVVVVNGTNPGAANITGVAADMDPKSPTYRYSPSYGEHVHTEQSEVVTTTEQAFDMAKYLLAKLLGPQDEVTFSCIPIPGLDVGDTVTCTSTRIGLEHSPMLVTHIEMPLEASGQMNVVCRRGIQLTESTPIPGDIPTDPGPGGTPDPGVPPVTGYPDLIITALGFNSEHGATPEVGDHIVAYADIRNIGTADAPAGIQKDVAFYWDQGTANYTATWGDQYTAAIPVGGSARITADGGPLGTPPGNYWFDLPKVTPGAHTLNARVNSLMPGGTRTDEGGQYANNLFGPVAVTVADTPGGSGGGDPGGGAPPGVIAPFSLLSEIVAGPATSFVTAGNLAATANRLVLLVVHTWAHAAVGTPTVTGGGLTWVLVSGTKHDYQSIAGGGGEYESIMVFRAMGASPSSGHITVTPPGGASWMTCIIHAAEFSNTLTTGTNGSGAIGQAVTGNAGGATSQSVTFPVAIAANNAGFVAIGQTATGAITPAGGGGPVELYDSPIADLGTETQFITGSSVTQMSGTWVGGSASGASGVEILQVAGGTGGGGTGGGGGGEPTIPASFTVGVSGHIQPAWGGWQNLFADSNDLRVWKDNGFQNLSWHGGTATEGQSWGSGGGSHLWEGWGTTPAPQHAAGHESYAGYYLHLGTFDGNKYGMADLWDDTTWASTVIPWWATNSAGMNATGFDGYTFDSEINGLGWDPTLYSGNTHTAAQNHNKSYDRGYAMGTAIWTNWPDCQVIWYSNYPHNGYNYKLQNVVNGGPPTNDGTGSDGDLQQDMLYGMLSAMKDLNAPGLISMWDATYYRPPYNNLPGCSYQAAYQLNNMGAWSYYSQKFSGLYNSGKPDVWNFAVDHFRWVPALWRGKDSTAFYTNTMPSDDTWVQMRTEARTYSPGDTVWEYTFAGSPGEEPWYASPTMVAGMRNNANAANLGSVLPNVVSADADDIGTSVRFNIVCQHPNGIRAVKLYNGSGFNPANPEPSRINTLTERWSENGGNYTTNYTNALLTWSRDVPGFNSGDWFVLKIESHKADVKWLTILAHV